MDRWFRLLMGVSLAFSLVVVVLVFQGATKPPTFHNVVPVTLPPGVTPGPNLDYGCAPGGSDPNCPDNMTPCQVSHAKIDWPVACPSTEP